MTLAKKLKEQQAELHSKLWNMCNQLRGNMQSSEFKNYILGLIFYRFLSEKTEEVAQKALSQDGITYIEAWEDKEMRLEIKQELLDVLGYVIEPKYLYSTLIKSIQDGNFEIEMLQEAINAINESTMNQDSQEGFDHLFEDMDLTSSKLGKDISSRSKLIGNIMVSVSEIKFKLGEMEIDILGDSYEFLIGKFSADAGKGAGEFFTPPSVSDILSGIVTLGKTKIKNAYDPTCGSGSLLLKIAKKVEVGKIYGEELTSTTFNLARMNLILHGVNYQRFDIKNGNTLENPEHLDLKFEAICANPPFSSNWSMDKKFLEDDRFSPYGKLAPKSKADFAFIQHMLYQLDEKGTMAVVLPHGVLFRGAAEGAIRKHIIENQNALDAVIGLPENIFYGTQIPTCILVFKKCREHNDNILFIDASNNYEKGKTQNVLRQMDIDTILKAYEERKEVEKFSHIASLDEIRENDYNLNIPRYVDTFEEEEPIDLNIVSERINSIDKEIAKIDKQLAVYLKELGL